MIDEEETKRRFGYTSDTLSYGSGLRVWRVCEGCGEGKSVAYKSYTSGAKICKSCARKGKHHSEESKKKMSENSLRLSGENNPMYGKHHSDETKQKISESSTGENNHNYGKTFSEEHKKKLSENHADNSGENHPMYGTTVSIETKQRSSTTKQGITYEEWTGFSSENLYAEDFTETVRMYIRAKYDNRCFLCNKTVAENNDRELSVHHIDMDKLNTAEQNLIPLCSVCHPPTHTELMIARLQYIQHILSEAN